MKPKIRVIKTSAGCLPRCKKIKASGKGDNMPTNAPKGGKTKRAIKTAKTRAIGNKNFCDCGFWSKINAEQKKAAMRYCGLA